MDMSHWILIAVVLFLLLVLIAVSIVGGKIMDAVVKKIFATWIKGNFDRRNK